MPDKKKYQSIYGATKPIRGDQYLVELIIERRSNKGGVKLPDRFWSSPQSQYQYWKNIFIAECVHAKKLFDKYDSDCIIQAFNSHECKYILSVTNKQLEKVVVELQRQKNVQRLTIEKTNIVTIPTHIVPKQPTGKKSKLSKLK
jgi:hypothetical protein